ncbi:MAG: hypothetical protein JWO06_1680, partial [Bacteroidota bacterium]|nr:hypothetical protein [Bacteroidota bacterium]
MKRYLPFLIFSTVLFSAKGQTIAYHTIQTDGAGKLIPWYSPNLGSSYDHDLNIIWNFWKSLPTNQTYYMTDHSYSAISSGNKVGGDQFAMALSSWALYYAYTGDTSLIANMRYIADTYLANSLSAANAAWPNIPYPCNYSNPTFPVYDGDYIFGPGLTQPDKAGSFAEELVNLFKMTGDTSYLNSAVLIANTLALKVIPGDSLHSPYPFKVAAVTGYINSVTPGDQFTADLVPTLRLFEDLSKMRIGNTLKYDSAYGSIKAWVQRYPQQNNNWGCFFEDIFGPSNTETNAVTMAWYIMQHPNWSANPLQDARHILDWTFTTFADTDWIALSSIPIFEQTADMKPGGSHTSRYAAAELMYSDLSGDTTLKERARRALNWTTYLVDFDGKCRFSTAEGSVWFTDGYGDYVRHFLRAMASDPEIAPDSANHLLGSTSIIPNINYQPLEITYNTYDSSSTETLRLTSKPVQVKVDGSVISELSSLNAQGWIWTAYPLGGVMKVRHDNGHAVDIIWAGAGINSVTDNENSLRLFPNPAIGVVSLSYVADAGQKVEFDVTDVTGKRLKEIHV